MKYKYIFFLICIGFLFDPASVFACEKPAKTIEKSCCSSKADKDSKEKKCCSSDASSDEEKSCDGSCGGSNCSFSPVFSSVSNTVLYEFSSVNKLIVSKHTNFFFLEKKLPFNYFAIWSPPKIG